MEIQRIRCVGGSRLDLRKFRVLGTIGRKKDVKNGVDCHSVNLVFSEGGEINADTSNLEKSGNLA